MDVKVKSVKFTPPGTQKDLREPTHLKQTREWGREDKAMGGEKRQGDQPERGTKRAKKGNGRRTKKREKEE